MSLESIFLGRERPQAPVLLEGRIVAAPGAVDQAVMVSVDAHGPRHAYGPCAWPARGALLPLAGDRCLVAVSDQGRAWVLSWWPYGEID